MTTIFLTAVLLAAGPNPLSLRSWLTSASRDLAEAARENPLTAGDAQFALLPSFVPNRPITYRARIKTLRWKDDVMRADIHQPLGWIGRAASGPRPGYTRTFYFKADAKTAMSLRRGQILIITAPLRLVTDYNAERGKTSYRLLTITVPGHQPGYYVTDKLSIKIGTTGYSPVYDPVY